MTMNTTPNADRLHIGIFGCRNSGKSALINALTSQDLAIVSSFPGTTADPVSKAMEILPIGPVVITDTAGYDDVGELGSLRTKKTYRSLEKTHLAILVTDAKEGFKPQDKEFILKLKERKMPLIGVINKTDLNPDPDTSLFKEQGIDFVLTSAVNKTGIDELKSLIIKHSKSVKEEKSIVEGLVSVGDAAVLVTPIDSSAPKGRLILPQQQTIRAILDKDAIAVTVKETELEAALKALKEPPAVVITDSQAFKIVSEITPESIPLTSFSILFARYKGELEPFFKGLEALKTLKPDDTVLISEGCTHHRQCNDIGTVKIPKLLNKALGFTPKLAFTSGGEFPDDLSEYALVIHCGGCMLNSAEVKSRIKRAENSSCPITNYGMFIAHCTGILERALKPLGLF
ncbi:MAG: [FeFe] hydrogenase H-cluster maturation GTPase HydF [Clostridiales bacterium]|nr:[FeFe] hydrogenase H-cluster maturation GTPase HydF [Clostridiales bacterium]